MSERPTLESFVNFSPKNTFIDLAAGRKFERSLKREDKIERKKNLTRWQKVRKGLAITAAIITPIAAGYAADIYQNYEYAANAQVSLNYVGPALNPANSDTADIIFNGFNSYSAEPIINTIGPAVQQAIDGQIIDVEYANAHLGNDTYPGKNAQVGIDNINEIADQIRESSKEHGFKKVVIVDYSLGCTTGTMVGENLTKNPKTSPLVEAFVNISCPPNFDSLRNNTKGEVNFVKTVSPIPGVAYSSLFRLGGEVYFLNQEYEGGDFMTGIKHADTLIPNAWNDISRKHATGTWTIFDQALLIDQGDFNVRLPDIAKNTADSLTPIVVDVRTGPTPDDPTHQDEVVNDAKGGKYMRADAQKAHMQYIRLEVPGAVHGAPEETTKQFRQTFAAAKIAIQQALGLQNEIYDAKQMQDLKRQPIFAVHK